VNEKTFAKESAALMLALGLSVIPPSAFYRPAKSRLLSFWKFWRSWS
jgi:hypothetical protein